MRKAVFTKSAAISSRGSKKTTSLQPWLWSSTHSIIIGFIFALALAVITFVWFKDIKLALVAFIAMLINHIFAGLAGILVPLGLKRVGTDPAVSSSVFVTTVTDIVGFFAFLGFAALILL